MSNLELWINRIVTVATALYVGIQYVVNHWPGLTH
jgi:hypothetical protein